MLAVVSDSSPFVYLTRLERFDLLRQLYEQVIIPEAVWREVAIEGRDRPEAANVRRAVQVGWLRRETISAAVPPPNAALADLGDGEREAILLARRLNALLIIDETEGREVAKRLSVRIIGTIGLLVEAKLRGLIPAVRPELERLKEQSNFRFTDELFATALKSADEAKN